MTRRRWIADEFSTERAALTGEHAAHLARTLRARVGQEFEVACGDRVRRATVASVADDRVEFALGEAIAATSVIPVTLLLAVFKFDRMEWAIEKCTELNVANIIPVIARRTEKHLAAASEKRVERWRRIAREASEQSRRTVPASIADPVKLSEALRLPAFSNAPAPAPAPDRSEDASPPARLRIVLDETEREVWLADILREHRNLQSVALAVGPEGGWTTDELRSFATSEWQWLSASLGETILRAETAVIAALAIVRAAS
ncbi:MAG: RsmE family RNA methyltransferase [Candidatus Korobacteraceae bacterium]